MTDGRGRLLAGYPVLAAPDLRQSLRFYIALGFTCRFTDDPDQPRYATVRREAVELHLQWMTAVPATPDGDRPVTRILVEDIDRFYMEMQRQAPDMTIGGSGPFATPTPSSWGTREWHLWDPAGNGLQFYQVAASPG